MSLLTELKRRNVFKVALAYGVTTWLIAQMAGLAAESFVAPDWVMKMLIIILLLGFPVVLIMAWAYEMTPQGLRRETGVDARHSKSQSTGALDRTIIIALVIALAYIAYDNFVVDPNREASLLETASRQSVETATGPEQTEQQPAAIMQSIAVLPFVNMSDDGANEYFADGLSEELLNQLVKVSQLQVAARTSSFSFKGKGVTTAQIARELNVSHILEGSVRKAGNRVRITAQLIKAEDGFHLWSETYDRTLDDIFAVQDDIANAVVTALKVSLMGAVPETRKTNPEVYSLYLQGMYFNNLRSEENLEKALALFDQALAIDADYAPAWIGISVASQRQRQVGLRSADDAFELSMSATEKALEIDSNMAAAWANLAYLKRLKLDWAGAESAINKAVVLEPNNTFVLGTAASLAGNLGQLESSIELFEKNVNLNPLSLSNLAALAGRYSDIGRFDEAIETYNRVIAINPDYPGIRIHLSTTYLHKGDPEAAMKEADKSPSAPDYFFQRARILSTLGNEVEAQALIDKLLETTAQENPIAMAVTYAWRGENDPAFEWFEKGYLQQRGQLAYFLRRLWMKGLESDSRYPAFVEKLGLLEAWEAMPRPDQKNLP